MLNILGLCCYSFVAYCQLPLVGRLCCLLPIYFPRALCRATGLEPEVRNLCAGADNDPRHGLASAELVCTHLRSALARPCRSSSYVCKTKQLAHWQIYIYIYTLIYIYQYIYIHIHIHHINIILLLLFCCLLSIASGWSYLP